MKSLTKFIQEQLENVICKDAAGNWRIKGHPGKGTNTDKLGYWRAKYKSKKDAEAALRGYFAHKNEDLNETTISIKYLSENKTYEVYVNGMKDEYFTKQSKKWTKEPKIGLGWYAGGTVFKIVKIDGNKIYVEEDDTCHP